MKRDTQSWMVRVLVVAGFCVAGVIPGAHAATVVLPRPGQVGIGMQGGFGTLLSSGDLGDVFGRGPSIAVRLRYRMRYERAIGLSFEGQRFDIRIPEAHFPNEPLLGGRTSVRVILSGLEFYQLFGTRTRTTKMISVGAGVAQTSGRTSDKDTFYPGDGAYVSVGAGFERFLVRSWALELSTHYQAIFLPQDRNHDVQVALGLMFYASY
jgi:hypothetical protein